MGASCTKGSKTTDPDKEPYGPPVDKKKKGKGEVKGDEVVVKPPVEPATVREAAPGSQARVSGREDEPENLTRSSSSSSKTRRAKDGVERDRSSRTSSSEAGPSRPHSSGAEDKPRGKPEDLPQDKGNAEAGPRPKKRTPKEEKPLLETNLAAEGKPEVTPRASERVKDGDDVARSRSSGRASGSEVDQDERAKQHQEGKRSGERKRSSLDNEFVVPVKMEVRSGEDSKSSRKHDRDSHDNTKIVGEVKPQRGDAKPKSDVIRESDIQVSVDHRPPELNGRPGSGAEKDDREAHKPRFKIEPSVPCGVKDGVEAGVRVGERGSPEGGFNVNNVAPSLRWTVSDPKARANEQNSASQVGGSKPVQEEKRESLVMKKEFASFRPKSRDFDLEPPPTGLTPISSKTRTSTDATVTSHHVAVTSRFAPPEGDVNRKSTQESPTKRDIPTGEPTMAIFDALKGIKSGKQSGVDGVDASTVKAAADVTVTSASVTNVSVTSASVTRASLTSASVTSASMSSAPVTTTEVKSPAVKTIPEPTQRSPPSVPASSSPSAPTTTDLSKQTDLKVSSSPPEEPLRPTPAVRTTIQQTKTSSPASTNNLEDGKISANGVESPSASNDVDVKLKQDRGSRLPVKGMISPGVSSPGSGSISASPFSNSSGPTSPKTPTSATKAVEPIKRHDSVQQAGDVDTTATKALLVDLSQENKAVGEAHNLFANTRTKLFQAVDKWLAGKDKERENASRTMVVAGRPGIGKTCLAVELCRRYPTQLAGSHFFQFQSRQLGQNFVKTMLLSIAQRLVETIPNYASCLPPSKELRQLLDDREWSGLFDVLISRPLQQQTSGTNMLIVVDGLDECYHGDRDALLKLISGFEGKTPDWLYLFCTIGDDNQLTGQLERVQLIELKGTSESMTSDIKRFVRDPMSRLIDRISLDGALTQLVSQSQGSFLAAYLVKKKLESLPSGTTLPLREVTLFPTGFGEICKEYFQHFYEHLSKKYSAKEASAVYLGVVGILAVAKEKLNRAFVKQVHSGLDGEADLKALEGLLDTDADGSIGLHHRSISDWLLSEQTAAPLAVNVTSARQKIADVVLSWLAPILEYSGSTTAGTVPTQLQQYALKHAMEHLTDVPKQQDNIAGMLCNLSFIKEKLKVPGVTVEHLRDDYTHAHYQTTGSTSKLITLEGYMKKSISLAEQIEAYLEFIRRKGEQISRHPNLLLQFAANYPTVARIQQNAQSDLMEKPWLEDITASAETPSVQRLVAGRICQSDISPDSKMVAVLARDEQSVLVYVLNLATGEFNGDPIDVSHIKDCKGTCLKFLPDNNNLFFGSFSAFALVKTGKPVTSGLDVQSIQVKENFTVECCDASSGLLVCGVNTLPWNGRSLHVIIFDLKSKSAKTLEVLTFRFGGSAQFGIKACALSADGSLLSTCVKQAKKVELKVTVWNVASWNEVQVIDIENDGVTRCYFVGSQSLLMSGGTGTPEAQQTTYLWSFEEKKLNILPSSSLDKSTVAHFSKTAQLTLAHHHPNSTQVSVSRWKKKTAKPTNPDDRYIIHGRDELYDLFATEKSLIFVSRKLLRLYKFADLIPIEAHPAGGSFALHDSIVESLGFIPRSEDLVVVHRSKAAETDQEEGSTYKISASRVSIKNDGSLLGNALITGELIQRSKAGTEALRCFQGSKSDVCQCTPDGSTLVINTGNGVKVLEIASGTQRSLPSFADIKTEPSSAEPSPSDVTVSCVLSGKESLAGVVYPEKPESLFVFDLKSKVPEPSLQLKLDVCPITDFCFMPSNGNVLSYHKSSQQTLVVWNQRNGSIVSKQEGIDVVCVRQSPSSDRLVVGSRGGDGGGALSLRNSDNRFNISLALPAGVKWHGRGDLEFTGDGTVLLGLFADAKAVRIWNAGNGESLRDLGFDFVGRSTELVGMLTNSHSLLNDNSMMYVVDIDSGGITTVLHSADRLVGKVSCSRGLRVSPKGILVAGSTENGAELRIFQCHSLSSVKRKTSLQLFRNK